MGIKDAGVNHVLNGWVIKYPASEHNILEDFEASAGLAAKKRSGRNSLEL